MTLPMPSFTHTLTGLLLGALLTLGVWQVQRLQWKLDLIERMNPEWADLFETLL